MSIELKAVGDCLKIDNRTLRYVVEAEMVPGIGKVNRGRGSRRTLTPKQAMQVAIAAALHLQGFRGEAVREVVVKAGKAWQKNQTENQIVEMADKVLPVQVHLDLSRLARNLEGLQHPRS